MNDKLEAFRKRLRGPEKEKISWQFWVGSPIAWLALIISSATAFSSLFYHSDQLSVMIPAWGVWLKDQQIQIQQPEPVTLINTGTRPIAIFGVSLIVVPPSEKDCTYGGKTFGLEFETTVVKPYDAVVKQVRLPNRQATLSIDLLPSDTKSNSEVPIICFVFEFAATDTAVLFSYVDFRLYFKNETLSDEPTVRTASGVRDNPTYLIKRNRFWTDVEPNGMRF